MMASELHIRYLQMVRLCWLHQNVTVNSDYDRERIQLGREHRADTPWDYSFSALSSLRWFKQKLHYWCTVICALSSQKLMGC